MQSKNIIMKEKYELTWQSFFEEIAYFENVRMFWGIKKNSQ